MIALMPLTFQKYGHDKCLENRENMISKNIKFKIIIQHYSASGYQ